MEEYRWDFAAVLHVGPRELDTLTVLEFDSGVEHIKHHRQQMAQMEALQRGR